MMQKKPIEKKQKIKINYAIVKGYIFKPMFLKVSIMSSKEHRSNAWIVQVLSTAESSKILRKTRVMN